MKLSRSMIAGLIALVIVLACGIVEVTFVNKLYRELGEKCDILIQKADDGLLTIEEMKNFEDEWMSLRETSELFLPHLDIYEINLRVVEATALVEKEDWTAAFAQLSIVKELLDYIPSRMIPNFHHIM